MKTLILLASLIAFVAAYDLLSDEVSSEIGALRRKSDD